VIDRLQLLLVAVLASALAWSFWHFGGQNAFGIFMLLVLGATALDNVRLRRLLKRDETNER